MTLPDVFLTVQDGGLGAITAQDVNNVIVIGNSSAGSTSTTLGPFYTRKADLIAAYGYGKGIEVDAAWGLVSPVEADIHYHLIFGTGGTVSSTIPVPQSDISIGDA